MAHVKNNLLTEGLSGKVGDSLIFRQRYGKTIVAKAPQQPPKEPSPTQKKNRARFQEANLYWKGVKGNPQLLKAYDDASPAGKSTHLLAVADFLNAPDIEDIDLSGYTGRPGQVIRIKVVDDFQVKTVTVTIHNEDGTLVEEGPAVPEASAMYWQYLTTASNESLNGDKITVRASDNPANEDVEERTIE